MNYDKFKPGTLLKVKKWNSHGPSYALLHRINLTNPDIPRCANIPLNGPPVMYIGCTKSNNRYIHIFLHDTDLFHITLAENHDIHNYFEACNVNSD